ncbi:MAG: hypothetical protein JJT82_03870 [Legionellaceae bacterium]|nr:hypothetical protein [Legionellaceae bacterium]
MSDLYDEVELLDEDEFVDADQLLGDGPRNKVHSLSSASVVDSARRRLEQLLEEKRLREELDDFLD